MAFVSAIPRNGAEGWSVAGIKKAPLKEGRESNHVCVTSIRQQFLLREKRTHDVVLDERRILPVEPIRVTRCRYAVLAAFVTAPAVHPVLVMNCSASSQGIGWPSASRV